MNTGYIYIYLCIHDKYVYIYIYIDYFTILVFVYRISMHVYIYIVCIFVWSIKCVWASIASSPSIGTWNWQWPSSLSSLASFSWVCTLMVYPYQPHDWRLPHYQLAILGVTTIYGQPHLWRCKRFWQWEGQELDVKLFYDSQWSSGSDAL